MKEIKEFPGYFVTEDGRVFSAWKQERQKGIQGIITYLDYNNLKEKEQYTNRDGYKVVSFYINGKLVKKVHGAKKVDDGLYEMDYIYPTIKQESREYKSKPILLNEH